MISTFCSKTIRCIGKNIEEFKYIKIGRSELEFEFDKGLKTRLKTHNFGFIPGQRHKIALKMKKIDNFT
jgi:hypothetical protein